MIRPGLSPRVEQSNIRTRRGVEGTDIAPFAKITCKARKGQVTLRSCTPMFLGNDVVDLVRGDTIVLVNQAVLTSIARTLDDPSTQFG